MASKNYPTPEELRNLLDYCPDTGVLTWRKRDGESRGVKTFNTHFGGEQAGTIDKGHGYQRVKMHGKLYLAHRIAWTIFHNYWPNEVDHINQVRTDNRISNLREVTRAENMRNKKRYKNNMSGASGVYWHVQHRKWYADVGVNGKHVFVGLFSSKHDAQKAREDAANKLGYTKLHGEQR